MKMRILGMVGSLLLTLVVAGCGSGNSLAGMPAQDEAEFKAAPKIDFSKPKKHEKHASKSSKAAPAAAAPGSDAMPE